MSLFFGLTIFLFFGFDLKLENFGLGLEIFLFSSNKLLVKKLRLKFLDNFSHFFLRAETGNFNSGLFLNFISPLGLISSIRKQAIKRLSILISLAEQ